MNDRSNCKGCGQEILWTETESGKKMPLSIASKQKRFIVKALPGDRLVATMVETFLSHFADCHRVDSFRKDKE